MEFNPNAKLDSSQLQPSSGGGGGGVALGGGLGLIVMILGLIFGFNPGDIMGGVPSNAGNNSAASNQYEHCQTGADVQADRECRWVAYVNSVQSYWNTQFQQGQYKPAPTVPFTGAVNTACGAANSQVGPFYCPADQKVYIDTEFINQLLQQLGAQGGYSAEAYIIAHEYGHHIQTLTGQLQKVQSAGNQTGPDSPQVRLEVQADCYAGVWFKNSTSDPNSPIAKVTQDDLNRIADAAAAVGDDRIQASTAGQVNPETWTHGSAKMRQNWLGKGFTSGDPNVCSQAFTAQDLEA
ncbi:KPN_02809 family neutral zinc metallopeptidase [Luteococcus sp. Sow4_B9]|uniref:KPN_02809 family neutral zinc metallopeptidase n=1 Tax=Luteococcus sp. Sow4_B9 TaxID=3438792 RepID=UPI003F9BF94A